MIAFRCANPNCVADIHKRTIAVEVRDLWHCGDHDERVLTSALIACSWDCIAALARDLAAAEPPEVTR